MSKIGFRIDEEFKARLRPQSQHERTQLKLLIQTDGPLPGSLIVADIHGDHILADGHSTYEICVACKIALPTPIVIKFPSRELALEWIVNKQAARRNLSSEELSFLRQARVERIAEARKEGLSTRTIAESEGISQQQVLRDLEKASGDTPVSPEEETPKIQGKDGKTYSPPKPVFCERCTRNGPARDCPQCATLRAHKPRKKGKAKPSKNGAPVFSLKTAREYLGKLMAEADKLNRLSGQKNHPTRAAIQTHIDKITDLLTTWASQPKTTKGAK